jgi:excisionase family DNA binding protein
MDDEYVTMREAQEILGVSNFTIWQMVKDGRLAAYQSGTDRRKKLVRRSDLAALKEPKPIPGLDQKKAVACCNHATAGTLSGGSQATGEQDKSTRRHPCADTAHQRRRRSQP